jgi:NitT/TauT family transport system substrate-binding protein
MVRIATQYGISYLPLTVMAEKKLLESEGRKLGLDLKAQWMRFGTGPEMNEALLAGKLDFASGGVSPLLMVWARTHDRSLKIKGISAISSMPLYLNTVNPEVKSIKDFTEKDRIALPAVRVSMQAIVLQMAAQKAFGEGREHMLDRWTVELSHPQGLAQMLGGKSEITAHFTSAPFMYQELADKRVRRVLNSYDVFGGPHTFIVVWATSRMYTDQPKVVQAFLSALRAALKYIDDDPADAAALWVKADQSTLTPEAAEKIIRDPENRWTMTPEKVMAVADYMRRANMIPVAPKRWKDLFIEAVHDLPGS